MTCSVPNLSETAAPAGEPRTDASPVLQVRDLHVHYETAAGPVKAVNGLSFDLMPRETVGLAGESGSGKSTLALTLLRLLKPPARIVSGEVLLDGRDLPELDERAMRCVRLADVALVAQGAMNSLNPVMRVREQIRDAWVDHGLRYTRRETSARIAELLEMVGLRAEVARMFPHELSGGMKQRVVIAIAICMRPRVIIADEPTSALDVVVQRQVIGTLRRVQQQFGAAMLLIGHDIGLMAQSVQRLGIMYAGKLAELAPIEPLFDNPLHPYTRMLIESLPSLEHKGELRGIPGLPPSLREPPTGCAFHPRCPHATDHCQRVTPPLESRDTRHWVACHLHTESP